MAEGKHICVIGSGISGLTSAWLLHRSGAKVTLFEKEPQAGGHTLTDDSPGYPVDLGFQVYNLTTYPNLVGLLEQLGVDSEPSDMSFALSMDNGALEWGSHGLHSIFAQRRNMLSPSFYRMVWDVIRFGQRAPSVLKPELRGKYGQMSLGKYVRQQGYSQAFVNNYLLPMCAAVWSVPNAQVMEFPVVMLVRFWANHHLLDLFQRPIWRVVRDRSRTYVQKILAELPDVRLGCPVTSAAPAAAGQRARVCWGAAQSQEFDAVIFATHSDTILSVLGKDAPQGVRPLLEAIPYGVNEVYLHTDEALMPRNRLTWASWNCIGSSDPSAQTQAVCVTYWLNNLQRLPADAPPIFATLNPPRPPAADKTIRRLQLAHPSFSYAAHEAQQKLHSVQGEGSLYYAGAWCGYGFHEDGLKAGMAAAVALGARVPWRARATCPKISLADSFFLGTFDRFARMAIQLGSLRLILPNGEERLYGSRQWQGPVAEDDRWLGKPSLHATVRVFQMSFFRKIITRHDTGLGEAYMDDDFDVDDLGALMAVVTSNAGNIESSRGALGLLNRLGDWLLMLAHRARANTVEGSRRNIEEHYDAGNAMYKLFLDDTMTYSSGIHTPGGSLKQAQLNKLDALIEKAGIKKSDHVLEIGCGWGSMAIHAVQRTGCSWTGLTVSKQQLEEGVARVKAAGLADSIRLLFCDYREGQALGQFDKVVSCEMIEAVGHENLPAYFRAISGFLKPGGQAVIQAISEPDERYEAYCASSDFIREHIFPGGHLPSMGAMVDAARGTGLSVQDCTDIGPHYAVTLREWRAAWEREREAALRLGYSQAFWRKYRFYFAYCEAAFDARYLHNFQILWEKSSEPEAAATSHAPMSPSEMHKQAVPPLQSAPSDPTTQVLLALYFFLAGCMVSQSRLMWVVPAASASFALLFAAVSHAPSMLSSTFRQLSRDSKAWWCADVVHMLYSAAVFLSAAAYTLEHPRAFLITWSPARAEPGLLPDVLVCISAGFFGFQLWALVCTRLFKKSYLGVIHYSLLLMLFGAAAFKAVHTPLLTAMLVSELASVLCLAGKMQRLTGWAPGSGLVMALRRAEIGSLVLFQLVPHFLIAVSVLVHPEAFSAKSYYAIAAAGCAYINASNLRKAIALRPAPKEHAR